MNISVPLAVAAILFGGAAHAQTAPAVVVGAPDAAKPATMDTMKPAAMKPMKPEAMGTMKPEAMEPMKPEILGVIYFNLGSSTLRPQDIAVLDRASRVYTDEKPTVMILTGSTDGTGQALPNLRLSQQRTLAVLDQLLARGVPAARFQLLATGTTDPAVPDPTGIAESRDRRVVIACR